MTETQIYQPSHLTWRLRNLQQQLADKYGPDGFMPILNRAGSLFFDRLCGADVHSPIKTIITGAHKWCAGAHARPKQKMCARWNAISKQAPLSDYFGVPPPPKKRQTESGPQKKRMFSEKCLQEVSWLQTNDERTEMWCRICRENPTLTDKSSAFYTGGKNLSHPAFDKRANSKRAPESSSSNWYWKQT